MQLAKFIASSGEHCVGVVEAQEIQKLDLSAAGIGSLRELLTKPQIPELLGSIARVGEAMPIDQIELLPPIDDQEVWAAGVTYKRSQTARMEESEAAADCYDRVYQSARPEIFFKATPHRVRGNGQPLRIRQDASWNVPEPELALVLTPSLEIVGYTVGNDMSSRDIEGDNPLYLPQAKTYDQCCGLGPFITLHDAMPAKDEIAIDLKIYRGEAVVYDQNTKVSEMARTFEDLVGWLGRDNSFPTGAFLLTGTGIVPDSDFTLASGDRVDISITGIGTLSNTIVQG